MCGVSGSGCQSIAVHARVYAKPVLFSSQAVGLLGILADSGSKQELFRHVSYSQNCPPHVGLSTFHPQSASADPYAVTNYRLYVTEKKMQTKKVRFAPDVVEPMGDSREYRGRKNINSAASSKACGVQQGWAQTVSNAGVSSIPNMEATITKLPTPSMPPNRMLLYRGMQCYRSKARTPFL